MPQIVRAGAAAGGRRPCARRRHGDPRRSLHGKRGALRHSRKPGKTAPSWL